ncbi:MAG: hypothetical protein ACHQ15_02280 [Candidatus Limnocylindrales bacterium]
MPETTDRGEGRADPGGGWLRRLTPLAWLFVVLALADLLQRALWLPPADLTDDVTGLIRAAAQAAFVLFPAAVLIAEPEAWRTSRFLFAGAVVLAAAELTGILFGLYQASLLAPDAVSGERLPGEALGDLVRFVRVVAFAAGPVLLGIGLALRSRAPAAGPLMRTTPASLLVLVCGIAIGGIEIVQVLGLSGPLHRLDVVTGVVGALLPVAWAFAAAEAIPDDGSPEPRRRGRVAVAAGAIAFVAGGALSILDLAVIEGLVDLPLRIFAFSAVLAAVGAALLIWGLSVGLRAALPEPT